MCSPIFYRRHFHLLHLPAAVSTHHGPLRLGPGSSDLLRVAIIKRLKALEMLDEEGALMLFKRRSARWGAKSEPGDEDRRPEQPRLLRRTIDLLVEEKVMPLDAIPRHIGLAAGDVEALAGLPKGYFQGKTNVVKFARLKTTQRPVDDQPAQDKVVPFRPASTGAFAGRNTLS